jgi:hypothetical protein
VYPFGGNHSTGSGERPSRLHVEDDSESSSSEDDRESLSPGEDCESLNAGDDFESSDPNGIPAEAVREPFGPVEEHYRTKMYILEDAKGQKKFYDSLEEAEAEANRLRQHQIGHTSELVDVLRSTEKKMPPKYAPGSIKVTIHGTTFDIPVDSTVEKQLTARHEIWIVHSGSPIREESHHDDSIAAQVVLRATSEPMQLTFDGVTFRVPAGCTLEMWQTEDRETWFIGSYLPSRAESYHDGAKQARVGPGSVTSDDSITSDDSTTVQSISSSKAKTVSSFSSRNSTASFRTHNQSLLAVPLSRKRHHEQPDLLPQIDEISGLAPELEGSGGLQQDARDDENHYSTQEQPDACSDKTGSEVSNKTFDEDRDDRKYFTSGNLHENVSLKAPGLGDSDSQTPGEGNVGSPELNREHSGFIEPRDQYQSLLSELPYWDDWHSTVLESLQDGIIDDSIDSPGIKEILPQPPELEVNPDTKQGAAKEIGDLESLELGKGRNRSEDEHAAGSELDMSKARTIDHRKAVAVFSQSRHTFLLPVLFALCVGIIQFAARDSLSWISRMLGLPAQDATLVSRCKPTAQRTSAIQIEQSTNTCHEKSSGSKLPTVLTHLSLRGLSGSVTCSLAGVMQYLEPPVPQGMRRIRWQCRCGSLIYDDFLERKPASNSSPADKGLDEYGSFSSTERAMHQGRDSGKGLGPAFTGDPGETGTTSSPQQSGQSPSQRPAQRDVGYKLGNISKSSTNTSSSPPGAGSLPTHTLGTSVFKITAASTPRIPSHLEFLLLCVPFKSHANKLLNVDTTTPPISDVAFFHLLRQAYTKSRGQLRSFFSIRALSEIRFVHFDAFRNDLVDVRKYDCVPPDTQKDNYVYKPLPDEHEPPPIGKNRMRHLYDYPDHADDVLLDCFSVVPRKLRERLSVCSGKGRSEGWGICFIEGVSWPRVCALGLAGVLASTIFGVVWTVVQKDIQGGFGVASYMLGVLVLGLGALQGAFEM